MSDRTETEETGVGIIAEMREGPIPRHQHDRELLHHYANRLEAALRRERGDCAKLREALVYLIQNESTLFEANLTGGELELLHLITNKARAALAEPPRNCDVGTAEKQSERFDKFCHANINTQRCCGDCPAYHTTRDDCELVWAQMPYEERKGDEP